VSNITSYSGTGRKATIEEKVLKSMQIMFPINNTMEQCEKLMKAKNQSIMNELMTLFVEEYSTYSENVGEARIDMESFKADIAAEEKLRKKAKKQLSRTAAAGSDNADDGSIEEVRRTCIIM
jgi:hypothetical protein